MFALGSTWIRRLLRLSVRLALCDMGACGWGSPGFRIVLCCFTHFTGVAMFVMAFLCFGVCLFTAIPDRVDTMLSPLRSLLDVAELANQSHSLLVLLVFCFGGFVVFLFVVCLWLLCFVSVHASSTFEVFSIAYVNALNQFIFLATCN